MIPFSLVAAADADRGIGREGDLPWKLPSDMAYFRRLTQETTAPNTRNAVVMGRKTWASIPPRFRPLEKRLNLVLTRQASFQVEDGVLLARTFDLALDNLKDTPDVEAIYIVGGGTVYQEAIQHSGCEAIYLTEVQGRFNCDTFFPVIPENFRLESRTEPLHENNTSYCFSVYRRA